jgi:hypothetical protein
MDNHRGGGRPHTLSSVGEKTKMTVARFLKSQMKVAPLVGRRDFKGALQILEGELNLPTNVLLGNRYK